MENSVARVLLIEDDPTYAKVVQHLLRKSQTGTYEVVWKADGEAALQELAGDTSFDLVLMDYFLSGQSGLDVVKQFAGRGITVPVVFLTTHKNFQAGMEAMRYGVEDYLVKEEVTDTALPRTLDAVLERVKVRNRLEQAEKQRLLASKREEAVRELIVTICHEFNNPLATIGICLDILSRQQPDKARGIISDFSSRIDRLAKEVEKLQKANWDNPVSG
jgi:CheY-like chemotaxis protein